jgi:hypothetical protein
VGPMWLHHPLRSSGVFQRDPGAFVMATATRR